MIHSLSRGGFLFLSLGRQSAITKNAKMNPVCLVQREALMYKLKLCVSKRWQWLHCRNVCGGFLLHGNSFLLELWPQIVFQFLSFGVTRHRKVFMPLLTRRDRIKWISITDTIRFFETNDPPQFETRNQRVLVLFQCKPALGLQPQSLLLLS